LSRIEVEAEVLDDVEPATVDDIIEVIIDEAIDLSLEELARVWPLGPDRMVPGERGTSRGLRPHSRTLFRRVGNEIQNDAIDGRGDFYTQHVYYKGTPKSRTILENDAKVIGEEAVIEATANLEALIGDKLDGAVYVVLEQIIANIRRS
jgi:hypothetical protein